MVQPLQSIAIIMACCRCGFFQLKDSSDTLGRPVVITRGADAVKLMNIVNTQSEARIRIIHTKEQDNEDVEVGDVVLDPFLLLLFTSEVSFLFSLDFVDSGTQMSVVL